MVSVALTERCYRRDQNAAFSRFANAHRLSKLRGLVPGQCLRDWNRGALGALRALPQRLAPGGAVRSATGRGRGRANQRGGRGRLQVGAWGRLRSPAIPEPPPVAETAAAPAVSENGDPAGPSLDQLIGTPAAAEVSQADEASPPTAAATLNEAAIPRRAVAADCAGGRHIRATGRRRQRRGHRGAPPP